MDCDDVMLALADRERRTLTDQEAAEFHHHLADCEECRALAVDTTTDWRWIARLPEDAFEDDSALVLPTIDPIVFDIDMEIAAGGMGRITKATDRRLGRDVALKEVLEPNMRARFEREALITARLQHPAIVPIYEAGTFPNGSAFYTMRLVWGGTLGAAIHKTKTMTERLALLPHVLAVIDALAYAHNNQIIHRDLKPGNVLIGEFGETVVIDWGLAKELGSIVDAAGIAGAPSKPSSPHLTRVGAVLGTPGFMSPEQASGGTIDERADVYALGAILYNLLAGVPPYFDKHEKEGSTQIIAAGLARPPTPIGELAPDAPADLRMICEKAMARAKEDRYRSAAEMAKELRNFQAGKLIQREYTTRELVARWIKKHRTPVAIGSVATVALAVVAVLAFVNISRSRDEAETASAKAQQEERKAQLEKAAAESNFAALLEEQGLRELLAGDSSRALTYLAAASAGGRESTALRYMIASASHDLDLRLPHDAPTAVAIAFTPAGELVAIEPDQIAIRDGAKLVDTQALGTAPVTRAWFDRDARHALVQRPASYELWDVKEGVIRWTLPVAKPDRVAFGGSRVAIADAKVLVVRDVATGLEIAKLDIGGELSDLIVDDNLVAVCRFDGKLQVWRKLPGPSQLHDAACTNIAQLEPGVLAVATAKFELLRWPVDSPRPVATMSGHIAIHTIAVDRKGQRIATGDATGVVMWKWNGDALGESRDVQGGITNLAWSPDGKFLVGSGDDHRLLIWDSDSFHLRQSITPGSGSIDQIVVDRDARRIAAVGSDGSHVWSVPRGRLIEQVNDSDAVTTGDVWIIDDFPTLAIRSLDTGAVIRTIQHTEVVDLAAGDGRLTMVGDGVLTSRELTRDDVVTRTKTRSTLLTSNPHFAVEVSDRKLRLVDARTGKAIEIATAARPVDVDISPDGSVIAVATEAAVTLHRDDGTAIATIAGLPSGHGKVARFDPTSRLVVLTGGNSDVMIADAQTGTKLHDLPDTRMANPYVAFSRKAPRLAIGVGNTVQLWEIDRDRRRRHCSVSSTIQGSFALSGDGSLLATGSVDGSIRITDANGRLLDRLVGSQSSIVKVEFAGDDSRLIGISGGSSPRVSLWDVHSDHRAPDEIAAFAAAHSAWKLNGVLLERAR